MPELTISFGGRIFRILKIYSTLSSTYLTSQKKTFVAKTTSKTYLEKKLKFFF